MPEFAEIEALRKPLEKRLCGHTIVNVTVLEPRCIQGDIHAFKKTVLGCTMTSISRYGKYGLIQMDKGTLVFHLRMSGQFYIQKVSVVRPSYTRIILDLENGEQLRYVDQRKFGYLCAYGLNEPYDFLKDLGPDVLDETINTNYLYDRMHGINRKIKPTLMDQHIIAGFGNIWADEVLFAAGIHPASICSKLSKDDYQPLDDAFHKVVDYAIEAGGMNHYNPLPDSEYDGHFDLITHSYGREGKPCLVCGSTIQRMMINGRSAFYCPHCQRLIHD